MNCVAWFLPVWTFLVAGAGGEQALPPLRAQCLRIGLIALEWDERDVPGSAECVLYRGATRASLQPHARIERPQPFHWDAQGLERGAVYFYQLRRPGQGVEDVPVTQLAVASNAAELAVGGDFDGDPLGTATPVLFTGARFIKCDPSSVEVVAGGHGGSKQCLLVRYDAAQPTITIALPELHIGGGTGLEFSVWVKADRTWHNVLGGQIMNKDRKPCDGWALPYFQSWAVRRDPEGWVFYHALETTPRDAAILNATLASYRSGVDMRFDDVHITDRRIERLDAFDPASHARDLDGLLHAIPPIRDAWPKLRELADRSRQQIQKQVQKQMRPLRPVPPDVLAVRPEAAEGTEQAPDAVLDALDDDLQARKALSPIETCGLEALELLETLLSWHRHVTSTVPVEPRIYNEWMTRFDRALQEFDGAKWDLRLIRLRYEK